MLSAPEVVTTKAALDAAQAALDAAETAFLRAVLAAAGSLDIAAEALGVGWRTLYRRCSEAGLSVARTAGKGAARRETQKARSSVKR